MRTRTSFRPVRLVADAASGLAIFLLLAGVLAHSCSGHTPSLTDVMFHAHAAGIGGAAWAQQTADTLPLAMLTQDPGMGFRGTDRSAAFVVLATVFTLLFVGNVALYRHVRLNYSRPRRRQGRLARR